MEYECQLVSAKSFSKGILDLQKPLCTHCQNKTCTNPITEKKISVFGVVHSTKLFNIGDKFFFVVQCDGFVQEDEP